MSNILLEFKNQIYEMDDKEINNFLKDKAQAWKEALRVNAKNQTEVYEK